MEQKLFLLSLILALTGITLLYAMSLLLDPPHYSIPSISKNLAGKSVTTSGTLVEISKHPKVTILTLADNGEIRVPLFSDKHPPLNLGDKIRVAGKVKLYEGELEIIPANTIKSEPPNVIFIDISQIDQSKKYRRVHLMGRIIEAKTYKASQAFILQDSTAKIQLYAPFKTGINENDLVEVEGIVDNFNGKLEVKLSSINKI